MSTVSKAYIDNDEKTDLSPYISKLTFEDSIEKDNMIVLTMDEDYALQLADDPELVPGTNIIVQFGYAGRELSKKHNAQISDIEMDYLADQVRLVYRCLDIGNKMKKNSSDKIWEGTATEIATEVAGNYGLMLRMDSVSTKQYKIPQAHKSDMEVLRHIAEREGSGKFEVFVQDGWLNFVERAHGSQAVRKIRIGSSEVLSFKPRWKESSAGKSTNAVDVLGAVQGEGAGAVVEKVADAAEETAEVAVEQFKVLIDNNPGTAEVVEKVVTTVEDAVEAKGLANSKKKKDAMKVLTATAEIIGDPTLVPNTILTVENVAKRHVGNWYIMEASHTVTKDKYSTILQLSRNASKQESGPGVEAEQKNTSEGAEEQLETVTIDDINGELVQ